MSDPLKKLTIPFQRDRLIQIKRDFQERQGFKPIVPHYIVAKLCGELDKHLTRSGRNAFLSWLCDREVSTSKLHIDDGLNDWDAFKLCVWAGIDVESRPYKFSENFEFDVRHIIFMAFALESPDDALGENNGK